jgi:hypothetical protein
MIRDSGNIYQVRCGLSLPTSRYDKNSRDVVGGFIVSYYDKDTGVSYLKDYSEFRVLSDVTEYEFPVKGLRYLLYTDSDYIKFPNARVHYVPKVSNDEIVDIIFSNLREDRLKYDRGGLNYKQLGLFLSNERTRETAYTHSLGVLLNGFN